MPVKTEPLRLNGGAVPAPGPEGNARYRTAVYISAGRWDRDTEDPAGLLSAQSEMCRKFLKEHRELKKTATYADRNSSRDTNREWNRLLDDAECRKMDAVLVASIAQVEESCGMASYFVGRFFYPAGIRFIAVEDGFDSFRDDMEAYLLKAANRYSSYLSVKRHENRFGRNKVCSVSVPYGYVHVPGGEPEIIVDKETAPYVRELFKLALKGTPVVEMARHMASAGAPTPAARRRQLYGQKVLGGDFWKSATVKSILRNPCYTGDYVTGRTRERYYDGKNHFETVPREEWMVIKDHHEALASREDYERSLKIMDSRRFQNKGGGDSAANPFRNLFICGHCGMTMTCNKAGVKGCKSYARICCTSRRFKQDGGCEPYDVRMDETVAQLRSCLVDEAGLAREFIRRLPEITEGAWYGETLAAFDEKEACQAAALRKNPAIEETELLYGKLLSAKADNQEFCKAFSTDNPWAKRFGGLASAEEIAFDRRTVKALFKSVEVFRDGRIIVHFVDEEWKNYIEKYLTQIREKGRTDLWAEGTG